MTVFFQLFTGMMWQVDRWLQGLHDALPIGLSLALMSASLILGLWVCWQMGAGDRRAATLSLLAAMTLALPALVLLQGDPWIGLGCSLPLVASALWCGLSDAGAGRWAARLAWLACLLVAALVPQDGFAAAMCFSLLGWMVGWVAKRSHFKMPAKPLPADAIE